MSGSQGTPTWVGPITGPVTQQTSYKTKEDQRRTYLMARVRAGELTIDDAVKMASDQGLYEERDLASVLHNFHIYKYIQGRMSSQRLILQFDFESKAVKTIQHGKTSKMANFADFQGYNDEGNKIILKFVSEQPDFEFETDWNDKTQIVRLMKSILEYNNSIDQGEDEGKSDALLAVSVTTSSAVQPSVLKEGVLEKKGHGAAFLSWPKRVVKITKGELYYAKPEDPETPLNIIDLHPSKVTVNKVDSNVISVVTSTNNRVFSFRIPATAKKEVIEAERNEWFSVIMKAMHGDSGAPPPEGIRRCATLKEAKGASEGSSNIGMRIRKSIKTKGFRSTQEDSFDMQSIPVKPPASPRKQISAPFVIGSTTAPPTSPATLNSTTVTPTSATAPSTSATAPSTSATAPSTSATAPSTSATAPSTSATAPSTSATAPSTSATAPSTSATAPSTSATAPVTTGATPPATATAPSTSATPTPTATAPSTSNAASPSATPPVAPPRRVRRPPPKPPTQPQLPTDQDTPPPSGGHPHQTEPPVALQVTSNNGVTSLSDSFIHLESIPSESLPILRVHNNRESSAGPKNTTRRRSWTMFMGTMSRYSTSRRASSKEPKEELAVELPPLVLGDKDAKQVVKCFQEELKVLTDRVSGSGTSMNDLLLSRLQVIAAELEHRLRPSSSSPTPTPSSGSHPASLHTSYEESSVDQEEDKASSPTPVNGNLEERGSSEPSEAGMTKTEDEVFPPPVHGAALPEAESTSNGVKEELAGSAVDDDLSQFSPSLSPLSSPPPGSGDEPAPPTPADGVSPPQPPDGDEVPPQSPPGHEVSPTPAPPPPPGCGVPPPPPPPGCGVPPPPPPPGCAGAFQDPFVAKLSSRWTHEPKTKMRPFHWRKVPDTMLAKSSWAKMENVTHLLDLSLLEEEFSGLEPVGERKPAKVTATKSLISDSKRAQNIGIFLSAGHLEVGGVVSRLNRVSGEGSLDMETVLNLKRFQPTEEESEVYKNFKGKANELTEPDQFLHELVKVPLLSRRLELLLQLKSFPSDFDDFLPTLQLASQSCKELRQSKLLVRVMEYTLSVGNYLNANTPRGRTNGFKLVTLTKLVDMKGGSRRSLLHYIMQQMAAHQPELLGLYEELSCCAQASEVSIKGIVGEFDVMERELEKIQKNAAAVVAHVSVPEEAKKEISTSVDAFLLKYRAELKSANEDGRQMEKTFYSILEELGEPVAADSEEIFTVFSTFLRQFLMVRKELYPDWDPSNPKCLFKPKPAKKQDGHGRPPPLTGAKPVENGIHKMGRPDQVQALAQSNLTESLKKAFERKQYLSAANDPANMQNVRKTSTLGRPKLDKCEGVFEIREGGSKKRWMKRYLELELAQLHVYKEKGGKYVTSIALRGSEVRVESSTVLVVQCAREVWNVRCESAEDAASLCKIMAQRSSGKLDF